MKRPAPGNGVIANKAYTPQPGRISTIQTGSGNSVQNLTFTFNALGNLIQRVDAVTETTDTLSYDGLNRLTQAVTIRRGCTRSPASRPAAPARSTPATPMMATATC